MRVTVDHDRCEAHEKCVKIAPDLFELRDDGYSYPKLDPVPESSRPGAERAVRLCPRQAIAIEE